VTRGLVQLENEYVDMKTVLTHAIEQVRPILESRHHELGVHTASGPVFVNGDRTRLVQVVANLLNNAAKYTPQGGQIIVSLEVHDGTVRLQVRDNGSGIAPTLLPYVFNLFAQGERTPDRSQGGLGLGLSLVKHITALHGGEATAQSDGLGKGSTFTIVLPLAATPSAQAHDLRPMHRHQNSAGSVNIMIVDDNIDAARSLAELLRSKGHFVIVAEDADRALSSVHKDRTQLFVLDIGLPGIDGYELARRLRHDPATRSSVIVALTGYGQAHDRVLSKAAGFDQHFIKPADMTQLEEVLKNIASSSQTPRIPSVPGA
jgi:CheY-like chemotaxis protein/two-component sensor histidine kinase